ncbi:MAG: DNA-formamidopyrimidine glycosylase [bacterium]|nr:DNA-formamidopyrimidine glycosylase [bacterium]
MPELPEVETVRSGLSKLLPNRTIKSITHDWDKSFPNPKSEVSQFALGSTITGIRRRAKVLMIDMNTEYSFVIHLKMTGQLVFVGKNQLNEERSTTNVETGNSRSSSFSVHRPSASPERFGAGHPNDSLVSKLPDKSTRVIVEFNDDSKLFFNDQRKFGWMKLMPTLLISEIDFMKRVGPEPLEAEFTSSILFERLQKRKNSSIKAALLDQTVLAGIGNIYADESLWGAKIHPATLVNKLRKKQVNLLHSEIIFVLKLAIEKGGSTDRNYVNAEGKRGSYIDFARVFRKENTPCPRCSTIIIKTRVAGRGTHLCPICQTV